MAENGFEKLKIKTVLSTENEEELTFSPEEMQPFEVAEALESDLIEGKTLKAIKKARRMFGMNDIKSEFRLSFRESLKNQIKGLTGVFLFISSFLMYLFRPDEITYLIMTLVIGAIIFLNSFSEFRASIALKVPKKYSSLKAKVTRNGEESLIDSKLLVPGDIITLESGMMIPADCRLIDDMAFSVLETHVSGKKGSSPKDSRYLAVDGNEVICANMVYAGSIVTSGHATAIVCRIGNDTLMKRMRSGSDEYTPRILKYVGTLSQKVSLISVIASFSLLFLGVVFGADITEWFICSLAIGASSLCDSMLSLCATSLGFGAKNMADDGMVIKNYNCIEKLSNANTVMCGKNLAFPPKRISLTGLYFSGKNYDREKRPDEAAEEILKLMLVCSDARRITQAEKKQKRGLPEYKGTPLDDAIVDYFDEWNKPIGMIRDEYIRLDAEYTLSGDISRMLTLRDGKNIIIVRGSPENILSRCIGYTLNGADYKLSDFTRKRILTAVEDSARTNSFLVAVATGETEAETLRDIEAEQRLIFKGFISFASSLDAGVASSVYRCESAGIETVLNSNDAYYTALNSAKSAGIITDETQIITAEQIRVCSRGLFIANAPYYRMFLNIDDSEWLDIVKLRKNNGRITAVTAERINELPIMNEADVSIVPETSTDTLRQTADVLMLGNGINLITDGILNAKTLLRRIRSVVKYLPSAAIMMLVASLISLFYNQITPFRAQDVLFGGIIFNLAFAFALAFEPRSVKNLYEKHKPMGSKPKLWQFLYPLGFSVGAGVALFITFASTSSYACSLISLAILLFLYAGSLGGNGSVFKTKRFGNRLLFLVGLGVFALTALLTSAPFCANVFGYALPEMSKIIISGVVALAYWFLSETTRYFLSREGREKLQALRKKADLSDEDIELDEETEEEEEETEEEAVPNSSITFEAAPETINSMSDDEIEFIDEFGNLSDDDQEEENENTNSTERSNEND